MSTPTSSQGSKNGLDFMSKTLLFVVVTLTLFFVVLQIHISQIQRMVIVVAPFDIMGGTCVARVYRDWSYVYTDETLQDVSPSAWWENFHPYGQIGKGKSKKLQMEAYTLVGVRPRRGGSDGSAVQVYFFDNDSRKPISSEVVPDSWMKADDLNLEDCDD